MQPILAVTVPFFALVLCGYLAGRAKMLPETAIPGLNLFVLYFALPAMLFRFGASLPVAQVLDPTVVLLWMAAAIVIMAATIASTRSAQVPLKDAALGGLTVAWPNTGFMGVPLLAALLGQQAAGPVITTLLVDLFFTSSLAIALAQASARDSASRTGLLRLLKGTLANPLPAAIALGLVFSALKWRLPGPLDTMVKMLGDAATPVALFTIGAILWRAGLHVHTRTPPGRYVPLALAKLFVHPLLVLGLGAAAMALGAPLSAFTLTVLVLAAGLPSASAVSLLAERFGADNGRITRIVIVSTALAFVSFSLLAWVAGAKPGA